VSVPTDDVPHIDRDEVQAITELLAVRGDRLVSNTGGVGLDLPPIPEDHVGLRNLIIGMDEARQSFDHQLATLVAGAAERAVLQVFDAAAADQGHEFLPLPTIAR
jgi:hypothetical protein